MAAIDELHFWRQNLRREITCRPYTSAVPFMQTFGQGLRVETSPGRQKCVTGVTMSFGASFCQTYGACQDSLAFHSEIAYRNTKQTYSGPIMTPEVLVSSKLRCYSVTVSVKFDVENLNSYVLRFCLLPPDYSSVFSQLSRSSKEQSLVCLWIAFMTFSHFLF